MLFSIRLLHFDKKSKETMVKIYHKSGWFLFSSFCLVVLFTIAMLNVSIFYF